MKGGVRMYLTVKQKVKHLSKDEYKSIKKLSHIAKNLTNEAIYNCRQYYFNEGLYLNYEKNYTLLKNSNNYRLLNSNMAQQILKEVDGSFKSFFGLLKLAKKRKYNVKDIKMPNYLDKNSFTTLVIGFIRVKDDTLLIPYSYLFASEHKRISIKIPTILKKLFDEMAIMESSYIDLEANFIGNLKPANSGNFELDNITLIDNLGVGINIPLEESVVIDNKNLIVSNIEDEDLKMPYAKNTDKPVTDIFDNKINKKILDRIDVQEKIEFVNNTLSAYDFEIAGRNTDVNKIEISNYENLNIVTAFTGKKISDIYDMLEKVCSKVCQNDMTKYEIIEEISRQCEKDNIEIEYTNFRENKQLTLDEVAKAYGKPNNEKELDL